MRTMPFGRIVAFALVIVATAATAAADTVRVVVDRALVWTQPGGVSIVMSQLVRGQTAEVVRRVGDWYEIVAPPGSGGGDRRTGFISASQVVLESGGPAIPASRPSPAPRTQRPATPPFRASRSRRALNIDGAFQAAGTDLTRSFTAFTDVFAEAGSISTDYGKPSGVGFEALVAQPIAGALAVGVGFDFFSESHEATVDARVPHPFFFNQLRTGTFQSQGLKSREAALHVPLAWMPPEMGSIKIRVFDGPSLFHVSQTLVTDLVLDEQYPFDTLKITGVKTAER